MQDAGWVMANGGLGDSFGLRGYILQIERPYADQNAMADVEGRPRPVSSYGGIDRNPSKLWNVTSLQASDAAPKP